MADHRSRQWYAGEDLRNNYLHRAWMRRGVPDHAFDGRPQIAIANTASDLTPCNAHLDEVATSVKQGVYEAGGTPLNMPVMSLGETQMRPTAMLFRNLAAMEIEEILRANPVDGVVLLGGCDKTIPALLMAVASVDVPAVVMPGGPMITGHFRGAPMGCGTDVWRFVDDVRAKLMTDDDLRQSESAMIRSKGHCNTMGTASTMAVMAEALGMTIPGVAGTRLRTAGSSSMRTRRVGWRWRWCTPGAGPATSSPRRHSTTPSSRSRRRGGPRTPWSTCWPSPGASASTCGWRTSTASAPGCRCC